MSIIDRIVSLYAPHACVGCGVEGAALCDDCYASLPRATGQCYRCKAASPGGRTCRSCGPGSPLKAVAAVASYDDPRVKDLLKALKFKRAMAAADDIGRLMATRYGRILDDEALIVPVPTARTRVRSRGYDQAVLIARSFARHSGRRYAPLLMRLGSQEQKGADRSQRQRQLQGAYILRDAALLRGARVILIDDVLTTGSTLEEVAATLKAAGAGPVGALVFARA